MPIARLRRASFPQSYPRTWRSASVPTARFSGSRGRCNMWFCAHAIFYFKLIDAEQDSFLVHENIYLVGADDAASAAAVAKQLAKTNEDLNEDGHLELNEKKTTYLFAGL